MSFPLLRTVVKKFVRCHFLPVTRCDWTRWDRVSVYLGKKFDWFDEDKVKERWADALWRHSCKKMTASSSFRLHLTLARDSLKNCFLIAVNLANIGAINLEEANGSDAHARHVPQNFISTNRVCNQFQPFLSARSDVPRKNVFLVSTRVRNRAVLKVNEILHTCV